MKVWWAALMLVGNVIGMVTGYARDVPVAAGFFTVTTACAVGFLYFSLKGGRTSDPEPELPIIHPKDRRRQFLQHDEWDTAYRRALPPTPGTPVWERRPYRKETP